MTDTDVKPIEEVQPDTDRPKVCQVKFTLLLTRRLKWPSWSFYCKRRATWSSMLMCCGDVSLVCDHHERMSRTKLVQEMRCRACGSINAQIVWSQL